LVARGWRKRQVLDTSYIRSLSPDSIGGLLNRHIEAAYQAGFVTGFAWACVAALLGMLAIVITKGLL